MRRFMIFTAAALASFAVLSALMPSAAQAQIIQVQVGQPAYYAAPTYVVPAVSYYAPRTTYSYYSAPTTAYYSAPTTTYYSAPATTYSYYSAPSVVTYSAPPVVSYSAPVVAYSAPVVTNAAPAVVAPAPGYYTTRSYYGYGILRPRGYNVETYYTPLR
jgi:hypothetical protein